MKQDYLVLWGWFSQKLVENELIPHIEKGCAQYGVINPAAYEIFQKNKFAVNSLYFHYSYAVRDIPIGQEYKKIALMEHYEILSDSVQTCYSKIICFFTPVRMQPVECAMRGYHNIGLIQFEQGVPQIVYDELSEITELPFQPNNKQICLYTHI